MGAAKIGVPESAAYHLESLDVSGLTSELLLDARLRHAVRRLESLPSNQSGTEKGRVERVLAEAREEHRRVVRLG